MKLDRRTFVQFAAGSLFAGALSARSLVPAQASPGTRALVFDAFPIFDPRPIAALANSMFPERGAALMDAWRARQFQYQWLRALAGQYVDFLQATSDSLAFASDQVQLVIPEKQRAALMQAWMSLQVWPDVPDALTRLHEAGLRLAFLSNMTREMLDSGLRAAGLQDKFEAVISTHQIRSYKPAADAYALATRTLDLRKEEILFVAFAGWDVAGAKWFGYPTYWLNRLGSRREALDAEPDAIGADMAALTGYALDGRAEP